MPRAKAKRPKKRSSARPETPILSWEPSDEPEGELDFLFAAPAPKTSPPPSALSVPTEPVAEPVIAIVAVASPTKSRAPASMGWWAPGRALLLGLIGLGVLGVRKVRGLGGKKAQEKPGPRRAEH